VYFVSETAQVELQSGGVYAPASASSFSARAALASAATWAFSKGHMQGNVATSSDVIQLKRLQSKTW
jgi:hypothetical protein